MTVKMEKSWGEILKGEFEKEYFAELTAFVKSEYKEGVVYPAPKNIFRAFDLCPFACPDQSGGNEVKVVILGQDPYHGEGQANGLAFAVDETQAIPPSLQNIFKEIASDVNKPLVHTSGDLTLWTEQGVLLLNATLTVRAGSAGSHQGKGWEEFTDSVIRALSEERANLVFMLWGNYAKSKGAHIDRNRHLVLEASHPSPFSAYSGFFGCKHFSKANDYLTAHNKTPINWL